MGYVPRTSFDEGLAQTVQWYRDHELRWRGQGQGSARPVTSRWLVVVGAVDNSAPT